MKKLPPCDHDDCSLKQCKRIVKACRNARLRVSKMTQAQKNVLLKRAIAVATSP